ncbi:MAG: C4-type zinc ribbon domain-containing protein [Candidatus Promineifilaceae bacterium]|nr:C4-type zinc ribbon domain-containing protein [Candidatus Promineifilaceae bacterium]
MSQVRQLYRLQQLDSEINAKKSRLTEVIQLQKETTELRSARAQNEEAAAKLQQWQTRQSDLNLELGSVSNESSRTEKRLYSGNVTNPKELADLQQKIESLGRRHADLEDELLEAMIMIEEAQEEKESTGKHLADVLAHWEKGQANLKKEQNELALRLHELLELRQKQVALIDARNLAEYDRLRSRKGGVAVAGLVKNSCDGCHLTVSATKISRVERGELVTCGGCGRILSPV